VNIRLDRAPQYLGGLLEVFRNAPHTAATFTMWRCIQVPPSPAARRSPIDSSRSREYAGRWHHPAESEALYTAATQDIALIEATVHLRPGEDPITFRIAQLRISGQHTLRLADLAPQLRWPIDHLLGDGKGYIRAIFVGTAACRAGVDVLIVPSAQAPQTDCAVCYMRHAPTIEVVHSTDRSFTRGELRDLVEPVG